MNELKTWYSKVKEWDGTWSRKWGNAGEVTDGSERGGYVQGQLVAAHLLNSTGPRHPMTSKAAKKAYREANKLPKVSKEKGSKSRGGGDCRPEREWEKDQAAKKAR